MENIGYLTLEKIAKWIPVEELSALLKASSALASTLDLGDVLQIAIESAVDLLKLDTGAIYTLDEKVLYLGATTPPLPPMFPDELRLAHLNDHPHILKTVTTKLPVYLENAKTAVLSPAEKIVVDTRHLISILYFPLALKDDVIGVLILGTTREVRDFSDEEIDLCYILVHQVSLAIVNAQLYEKNQQAIKDLIHTYDATLEGWSSMVTLRDHETDEHSRRVVDLTVALAVKMGIAEPELVQIRRGALLHDIGKLGVPDKILRKKSELSQAEWAVMRTHPELAYHFLSKIDYLFPAVDIPYCHHERWDGTGYPRGLKGEQIPVSARLFAVVDVYDALTSDRPYRRAWRKERALQYIENQSGRYFCPEVVQAFLKMIKERTY
jgi:HD-GYP domain-containing protein (c-di-GMP phosphodiesterase class II)